MIKFLDFLTEAAATASLKYEEDIKKLFSKKLKGNSKIKLVSNKGGGNDNTQLDLYLNINSVEYPFEIKYSTHSSSGRAQIFNQGTDNVDEKFPELSVIEKDIIRGLFKKVKPDIVNVIKFLKSVKKEDLPDTIQNKDAAIRVMQKMKDFQTTIVSVLPVWELLKQKSPENPNGTGLLNKISSQSESISSKALHKMYAKKNCYYIQIGGKGLYYLQKNPLGLDIPQLNIESEVNLRLIKQGGKETKELPFKTQAQIRTEFKVTGRLQPSPISIDNEQGIEKFLIEVENAMAKKESLHIKLPKLSDIREDYVKNKVLLIGDKFNHNGVEEVVAERKPNFVVTECGNKIFVSNIKL